MEKDVLITILSSQDVEGEQSRPTELISRGKYSYTPRQQYLSYMESELTGLEGTKTEFSTGGDQAVLTRTGSVTSRMVFEKGRRHNFSYDTPYGTMNMGMQTQLLESDLKPEGGSLRIEYELSFENVLLSRNKIYITIAEC